MKLLLLGANGQVGWELRRSLSPLGEFVALDVNDPPGRGVDFSSADGLSALVRQHRPSVIVNAAAYTAVDKAESDRSLAELVNATAPGVLARAAASSGALLIHYSTDYVFDGSGSAPRSESDPTGPLSVYGETKLAGEKLIAQSGCDHLILRTSWVYAVRGHNFIKTMLRLGQEREALSVVDDQVGAPTGADLLADVTALLIRLRSQGAGGLGVYHCVAAGETSWFGLARYVLDWARANGLPIKTPPEGLRPLRTADYPTPARRPMNSRLSTSKLASQFDLTMPHWTQGVERMLKEYCSK